MKFKISILSIFLLFSFVVTVLAEHGHDGLSEVIAFGRISEDIPAIIDEIEKISKGVVVEVRYEKMSSLFSRTQTPYVFRVEALTNKGVIEYQVNPSDLKVLSKQKEFFPQFKSKTSLENFPVHLKEAVIKAQNFSGGKAFRAETEKEDGLIIHKIWVVQNNRLQTLAVDPLNGNVFTMSDENGQHHNQ